MFIFFFEITNKLLQIHFNFFSFVITDTSLGQIKELITTVTK